MSFDRYEARRIAADLQQPVDDANELAERLGLEPYPVNYWIVDYDEMNQLIAYDGFQRRYPHWRWGMKYDKQRKQDRYGGGKAFEIVNNDNPSHAFLQESNDLADQKAVVTHVEAHADFFANNEWFGMFADDLDAAAMLERHARTIDEYMQDPDIDRAEVERWIDNLLTLEDNIDQHQVFDPEILPGGTSETEADDDLSKQLSELELSDEVREEVFSDEWLERQGDEGEPVSLPDEPQKDVLAFLRAHGKQYEAEAEKATEMEPWQRDVLDMLRAEAYYFAAQKMTKVMNEGWACVAPDTLVFTADGLVPMEEVVGRHVPVSDGEATRDVYDSNVISDHDTVTVETRRGFELTGSNNHRVRRPDGSWVRLDELDVGDGIEVTGGNGVWPSRPVPVDWTPQEHVTLQDVADEAGVSVWTVMRYRRTGRAERADAIDAALSAYDGEDQRLTQRDPVRVPETVSEEFGRFLGLLVGDGHVSSAAGVVGFTNGDRRHADHFAGLADELFGVDPTVEKDGSRWRAHVYSDHLVDLLVEVTGLPDGEAADRKSVPGPVLRSPKAVVAEFLRGLFDADGYAGDQGIVLSTKSEPMSETVQLLLTNFGILSRRREQADGCYHVHVTGESAERFVDRVGFGFPEKASAIQEYLDGIEWDEDESWTDEVVAIEESTGTVYDISVEETHRYAGAGFVNHNSYWESTMMSGEAFADADEFVSYADHMARVLGSPGLNPYSLGKELWEYVENTTNRREVVETLLRVEGITWRNFTDTVDFERVLKALEPPEALNSIDSDSLDAVAELPDEYVDREALDRAREGAVDGAATAVPESHSDPVGTSEARSASEDAGPERASEPVDVDRHPWKVLTYEGLARRHYSLVKRQYRGFLGQISQNDLEHIGRYMFDDAVYDDVDEALDDVDFTRGWDRMREIRESHNDVTFLDEFLTQEFVDENEYFTYEYSQAAGQNRVASTDYEDVKKKLLLQFTNFGKPTVAVYDGNYNNRNELLLGHHYNGVMLDIGQARRTLERVFELWGRPVNLMTIVKEVDDHDVEVAKRRDKEPDPEETGKLLRYDGEEHTVEDLPWEEVEDIAASDVDYDTKPDEWLT
ncbi:SpoVR family protein [Halobacteriales archaeon QS_9_68_17]|nr:MAG: SpoVR family protein [Halobacteriales archaeon QS_9_68_17]